MKVYEIIKITGLGVMECPSKTHPTGMIYDTKEAAQNKANELWLENTTDEERKSGWCPLNYSVSEVEIQSA